MSGRRVLAADEKPRHWVGSSKRDFLSFPAAVKEDMGNALGRNTMASKSAERKEPVTRGTGNVFADLGFPDAAERQARLRLAYALNQELEARKISQADAAKVLGVTQPKVSALRRYKLEGFSVERLMNLLTALGQDVEIVIRRKPRSRRAARISVAAA
jgi:predicted XRE-type DNA-binding protein